jgi:hypothetical protein
MQNLHIEHPEDSILTGDLNVLDWFVAAGTLSVKMDGAPAIVWGTDPATNTFFVGTKAVFNKVKIRIAHSHEEIDQHYEGNVAEILHECFDYLPRTEGIFQGDFIGYGGDCEYTPNTITYQFPDVISQRIIIAPHTVYEANDDLRDSWTIPLMLNLDSTENVLFVKPKAYILHNQRSFADVEEVCDFARQMSTVVNFASKSEAEKIKKQINACIREQRDINAEDFECDRLLIEFWKLIKSIKEDCLFLCRNDGPSAYIQQDRIDAEGYVMSNEYGTYKLVNREFFSHANFTMEKAWSK